MRGIIKWQALYAAATATTISLLQKTQCQVMCTWNINQSIIRPFLQSINNCGYRNQSCHKSSIRGSWIFAMLRIAKWNRASGICCYSSSLFLAKKVEVGECNFAGGWLLCNQKFIVHINFVRQIGNWMFLLRKNVWKECKNCLWHFYVFWDLAPPVFQT